ncbi:hypothetical protein M0804_001666 [Polistes exclamans]|nr:hypothetical protein M0804_001666 [Polistes exclamans]
MQTGTVLLAQCRMAVSGSIDGRSYDNIIIKIGSFKKRSTSRKDARLSGESVQGRIRCYPSQREFSTVKGEVVVDVRCCDGKTFIAGGVGSGGGSGGGAAGGGGSAAARGGGGSGGAPGDSSRWPPLQKDAASCGSEEGSLDLVGHDAERNDKILAKDNMTIRDSIVFYTALTDRRHLT